MTIQIKKASVLPGMSAHEHSDWLLCAGRHRDSGLLEQSNFDCILAHLGGESDTVEVHRFGHFAVGWIEEILVHPSRYADVKAILEKLDEYPVWDEDDWNRRESLAEEEYWELQGYREFVQALTETFGLSDSTHDFLLSVPVWELWGFHCYHSRGDEVSDEGSVDYDFSYMRLGLTRDQLAQPIREWRKAAKHTEQGASQ